MRIWIVTIGLFLAGTLGLMTLRVTAAVNPVTMMCSATDKSGRFVPGLGPADFTVTEEGKRQTVSGVADVSALPLRMALLLDISGSIRAEAPVGRIDLADFFQLSVRRGQDQAAVVAFHGSAIVLQDYSDDAVSLAGAIRKIDPALPMGSTALYDVLNKAVESLAQFPLSRKVLVLMSDGEDTSSRTTLNDVQKALRHHNVKLYMLTPPARSVSPMVLQRASQRAEAKKFSDLVEQTGGLVLRGDGSRQTRAGLQKIGTDLHAQYALSYDSDPGKQPGSMLTIRVSTTRKGVDLRCPTAILAGP